MSVDHRIFTTPLIDSAVSYLTEQPIQYFTYKHIFSKMKPTTAAIGVAFVSMIVNIIVLIVVYTLTMGTNLRDSKLWKQVFITTITGILLMPIYTYASMYMLRDYSPEKRIIIHTIIFISSHLFW